jgi:hypothetical protein
VLLDGLPLVVGNTLSSVVPAGTAKEYAFCVGVHEKAAKAGIGDPWEEFGADGVPKITAYYSVC